VAESPDVTWSAGPATAEPPSPRPYLFIAFEGARPDALSARYALHDVDVVTIGRGSARTTAITTDGGQRTLALTLPDPLMSTRHATLTRELGRWIVADAGSKNGTFADGEHVERGVLPEGVVLEVGHTLLILERRVAPASAGDVDASALPTDPPGLATLDPELARELDRLRAIAPSLVPVVITGETGTGKELIARAVHALSGRSGPLVAVNCGALPATLVESELFGARRGAYSGATDDRIGLVRQADGGTLFLDEIGELPLPAQAALLRVLQEREVTPVGDTRPIAVDFRLVTATLHDLEQRVAAGAFRADLYARLAGFQIELPALRDRRHDLGLVVGTLLARHAPGRPIRFALDSVRALGRYDWPGNIREVERCLFAALALAGTANVIDGTHLPPAWTSAPAHASDAQRDDLLELLRRHRGNISAVARHLGKARMQVQRWIARYGIDVERYRS
jgi:DNA-binding NtrC family response regulator